MVHIKMVNTQTCVDPIRNVICVLARVGQKNKKIEFFFGTRRVCLGGLGEPKKQVSNL